jgi:hypothetical protein
VSFVENDTVEGLLRAQIALVVDNLGIRSNPYRAPPKGFRISWSGKDPFSLTRTEMVDGKATSL